MFKSTQINQKVLWGIALALLSLSATPGDAQLNVYCDDSGGTTTFLVGTPKTTIKACAMACLESVSALTAAKTAHITACDKAVSDSKTACVSSNDTCANGATAQKNACDTMQLYVQAATEDSNTQTLMACTASLTALPSCNAAYAESYTSCKAAHETDYTSCNSALDKYVQTCVTPGTSTSDCTAEFSKAKASCISTALAAKISCATSQSDAELRCLSVSS